MGPRDRGAHVGRGAGPDRPPRPAGVGRYLAFLLLRAPRAGRHPGAGGGRRPTRMLFVLMAENGNPVGWGLPETRGALGDPTVPPREYLSGFREVVAGPPGPPPGRPSREPPGNHTDFISGGGPGRLPITPPTRHTDPRFPAHARGRENPWRFLDGRAVLASGPVPEINQPVPANVRRRIFCTGGRSAETSRPQPRPRRSHPARVALKCPGFFTPQFRRSCEYGAGAARWPAVRHLHRQSRQRWHTAPCATSWSPSRTSRGKSRVPFRRLRHPVPNRAAKRASATFSCRYTTKKARSMRPNRLKYCRPYVTLRAVVCAAGTTLVPQEVGFLGKSGPSGRAFPAGRPIGKVGPVKRREWPCSNV